MTTEGNSHLKLKMIGHNAVSTPRVGSECLLQSDMCLEMEMGCEQPGLLLIGRPLEVQPCRALYVGYLQILSLDSVSPHHPKNLKQFVRCSRISRTL